MKTLFKFAQKNFFIGNLSFFSSLLLIFIMIFITQVNELKVTDPIPENVFIIPQMVSKTLSTFFIIKTGFILQSVPVVELEERKFEVAGLLWFEYDPDRLSLDIIDKFSFSGGEILFKSPPDIKLSNGLLLVKYLVKVRFSSELDYAMFPFDDHRIYFTLTNLSLFPSETIYQISESDFVVSPQIMIPGGWDYKNKSVVYGETPVLQNKMGFKEKHPQVTFMLELQKNGLGVVLTIIIPLLIMFYISLISIIQTYLSSLRKDESLHWTYSTAIGNMAAILAYRFVIQSLAPKVSYLTISDYLYIYVLIVSLISFIFPLLAFYFDSKYLKVVVMGLTLFFNVALVSLFYYLLFVRS